ncbi:MAG: arylsulfatase A-like enzyme [Saprospiraceae bacterium]|jgi:arylsulfatase A-like enzyme
MYTELWFNERMDMYKLKSYFHSFVIQGTLGILLILFCLLSACNSTKVDSSSKDDRPNIVIIMGDDIGYSDIGCYGAEINTPNLDRLAANGMRFKQFYNMAKCNPTRSSLITGLYEGNERAISFVPLLRDAGYNAVMSGKEHFDKWVPQSCYFAETFEKSFTFWATTEYFVPPDGSFQRPFYLNGAEIAPKDIEAEILPKYKTDFITDYAIKWLDEMMEKEDPFLLLLPYHAAHYPLQARPEDIAKYQGKYMKGWDLLRAERFAKMKDLGILDKNTHLSPAESNTNRFRGNGKKNFPEIRAKWNNYENWDGLSAQEKIDKDLEMSVYAAIIDRMDQNIGRVLDRLEAEEELENTLVLFFTDNGSCPFDSNVDFDIPPGPTESYRCLSPTWGNFGNTPFRLYKQNGHEGGANTHLIAHWPNKIKRNQITNEVGTIVDLFPTILEMANISYPEIYKGTKTLSLDGTSLLPVLQGKDFTPTEDIISGFTDRFRSYRSGDWKIVKQNAEQWELYNMRYDRTEVNDLAIERRDKLKEIVKKYEDYQKRKKLELSM